ncbi:hypothetical protein FE783_16280 [Paenibacillus mesophilus]|uniref:hypothetical protein n=1 Tax=Paenibacillus mesophilus TaxID=2582849 RepID=UPI00110F0708|nr:hypothetical protein [Paenibacillus mesophilus]TMV48613.1 hypothetical protein FE783_16280 [Paenibacillus mesophilus]
MERAQHDRTLKRVTLEMGLKPFKSLEPPAIDEVCAEAIRQWLPLVGLADHASMLLWVADGSEILTWDGHLDREIEWARYIGFCNEEMFSHTQGANDPKTAILYTDEPVRMTYRHLQTIVSSFKRVAAKRFGIRMEVGATFDAGPEFAYSDFKYRDHPEINRAEISGKYVALKTDYTVVCSWSKLREDRAAYAAYPDGIPEGTPFGEYLGRQCASFLPEIGFDYIWFSNGFALSYFPWTYLGAGFDGNEMGTFDYREVSGKVLSFWELFKRYCPGYRTEVRGTNFGTGMDLAKDCIPLLDLYENRYLELPPPNSPWGALNFDFGLEMTGYMSRMSVLPGTTYPYRFYANDTWFWQNPWWDVYDREPHDIYCPLMAGRMNGVGAIEPPGVVEILTIDTERGELNEDCALEIVPHIRKALKDFPDQAGILTWVYPFRELHAAAADRPGGLNNAFFHDWFVRNAINNGLPLNTVISSDDFFSVREKAPHKMKETILFTSAFWLKQDKAESIVNSIQNGEKVLIYGPLEDPALLRLLNLRLADGLDGDMDLFVDLMQDPLSEPVTARKLRHVSLISAGSLRETIADTSDAHTRVRAVVKQGSEERAFAVSRSLPSWNGGTIGWIRGSLPFQIGNVTSLPIRQANEWTDATVIARYLLQDFGYTLLQAKTEDASPSALLFIGRRDNGFIFTGCRQDTSVLLQFRFPEGVPVLMGQTSVMGEGVSTYALDRTFRDECHLFVNQKNPNRVVSRVNQPFPTPKKRAIRNITVSGLQDAVLTIYPPLEALEADRVEVLHNNKVYLDLTDKRHGNKLILSGITGRVDISW